MPRRATPDPDKLRRGQTRPSRLRGSTPTPPSGAPTMPAGLSPEVAAVWGGIVAVAPWLTAADADAVTQLAIARFRRDVVYSALSQSAPAHFGLIARRGARGGHGDEVVAHPNMRNLRHWQSEVARLERALGLTPRRSGGDAPRRRQRARVRGPVRRDRRDPRDDASPQGDGAPSCRRRAANPDPRGGRGAGAVTGLTVARLIARRLCRLPRMGMGQRRLDRVGTDDTEFLSGGDDAADPDG